MNIFLFKQDVLRIVTTKVVAKRGRAGQQAARKGEEVATGGGGRKGTGWEWLRGARMTEGRGRRGWRAID